MLFPAHVPHPRRLGATGRSLLALALLSLFVLGGAPRAHADDSCDTSEPIACIPLPVDSSALPPVTAASAPSIGAATAAPPSPSIAQYCPLSSCCPPYAGASGGSTTSAVPNIPVPPSCCGSIPPPGVESPVAPSCSWCSPQYPGLDSPITPSCSCYPPPVASPASPVSVPPYCAPWRSIYTTINRGNAAEARALRTLSTSGLRDYWRREALQQIEQQIDQLQYGNVYVTARLYSIQVQDRSFDQSGQTATVHTLEHWLYQQRSQFDGSVVFSQDQWAANEYDLTRIGGAWYITGNTATLVAGPTPYPLGASGG